MVGLKKKPHHNFDQIIHTTKDGSKWPSMMLCVQRYPAQLYAHYKLNEQSLTRGKAKETKAGHSH